MLVRTKNSKTTCECNKVGKNMSFLPVCVHRTSINKICLLTTKIGNNFYAAFNNGFFKQ